jgi:adenine-specific DNA-methyltransferase
MAEKFQKLELTWIGKGEEPKLEPRILLENPDYSYSKNLRDLRELRGEKEFNREGREEHEGKRGSVDNTNMLIHGDNLLALKALEQDYTGKIKCIAIDPPYNTGQAFEFYDDGLETSIWLSLMYQRLIILKRLLSPDGVLFVQLDDNYQAHMRILLDEIFGKSNYINTITVKTKESSGASGGGEDRRLKKNIEFIICYAREKFIKFNDVYSEIELGNYLEQMDIDEKSFKYTTIFIDLGQRTFFKTIKDGAGNDIEIFKHDNYKTKSVKKISEEEGISEIDVYYKYFDKIMTTENAQTSIRTRVQEATDSNDTFYSIDYYPVSGRNKGKKTTIYFIGNQKRLVGWFKNVAEKKKGRVFKREKLGTFWEGFNWNNVTREGGVRFPKGQKPEALLKLILELSTSPNDIVLDSFLGSGTTAAVAHKMGRRWIGIELGEHAVTHCVPRLQTVIDGTDQGGISKEVGWTGGGGFKFYTLAPSLLNRDKYGNWIISKEYNPTMLASAMAKQEGFRYLPDERIYWKQGKSSEKDYIYTTTQFITIEILDKIQAEMQPDESLLLACKAYHSSCEDRFPNITIKKIPHMLLGKCEFGKEDYSLNIVNSPIEPEPLRDLRELRGEKEFNSEGREEHEGMDNDDLSHVETHGRASLYDDDLPKKKLTTKDTKSAKKGKKEDDDGNKLF